jgi:hypothetical protein
MRALVTAAAGLLAAALALRPIELAGEVMPYALLGGLGIIAFALALFTQEWVLSGPGAALLIFEYLLALNTVDAGIDPVAPVLAVAGIVLLELVDLSLLLSGPTPDKKVLVRHGRYLVVVVAGGAVLSVTAWAGGQVITGSSVPLLLGAAVGGVGALAIAVGVIRRSLAAPKGN